MTWRITAGILLFISVFLMPFWVSVVYALVCLYFFDSYYEVIPAFALGDFFYGAHESRFHGFVFVELAVGIIIVVGMRLLKQSLRK